MIDWMTALAYAPVRSSKTHAQNGSRHFKELSRVLYISNLSGFYFRGCVTIFSQFQRLGTGDKTYQAKD